MVLTLPSMSRSEAVVVDANIAIAMCAKEDKKEAVAAAEIARYSSRGCDFYAPGVIVTETLYILCQQLQSGLLTPAEHAQAVGDFDILMSRVLPPPRGDASLIKRAEELRAGYGCSRSADGVYIALAEQLAQTMTTTLLTFDKALSAQVAANSPTIKVHLLTF